jgi:hypothetical protein
MSDNKEISSLHVLRQKFHKLLVSLTSATSSANLILREVIEMLFNDAVTC